MIEQSLPTMIWDQTTAMHHAIRTDVDEDLAQVARFLEGEESAFTSLVNKYRKTVYAIAFKFTHNHQEADDLTQDTFVKAYQGLAKFRKDSSFKTWLLRIATNLSINTTKSGRIRKDSGEAPESDSQAIQIRPLESMIAFERKRKLYQAMVKLPPRQREALTLKSLQDMRCQEVADIMECSVGTVKANVFNAMKNLKKLLESESV